MLIIDEIKKANIQAMKDKNVPAKNIYSLLLSEIKLFEINNRTKQKEMTEGDVLNVIQKNLKELGVEKEGFIKQGNKEQIDIISQQEDYVKKFLPKMLTEKEIIEIIEKMQDKSIPNVMRTFKANYNGKCNMGLVSQIAKRFN